MHAPRQLEIDLTNQLLAALPRDEYERLTPHLRRIRLTKNNILYDAGDDVHKAYFVQSGVVSLVSISEDGENVEAGIVGCEGLVGIPAILRCRRSPFRVVVQIEGEALTIDGRALRREFKRGDELHEIVLCFMHTLVSQFAQAIVCNRFHTVEKRLSRWLLMARDRVQSNTFHLTHEFLSYMLGTARTDVTKAVGALHDANLIRSRRGSITILDEKGLEATACACYRINKEELDQFLAA